MALPPILPAPRHAPAPRRAQGLPPILAAPRHAPAPRRPPAPVAYHPIVDPQPRAVARVARVRARAAAAPEQAARHFAERAGAPGGHSLRAPGAPSAADRHQAALHLMALAHAHHDNGGFLGLGAVVNPIANAVAGASGSLGHIAHNLGHDVVGLGPNMLQGIETLGGAAFDTLAHGHFGAANLSTALGSNRPTELQATVHAMANADPLYNLATGHLERAKQLAEAHPLNAILDATGGLGAIGRTAGAAGRLGRLDAAALGGRPARVLSHAVTEPRAYSNNLLTKQLVQRPLDAHPVLQAKLDALRGQSARQMLIRRGNEHHMMVRSVEGRAYQRGLKQARAGGLTGEKANRVARAEKAAASSELHSRMIRDNSVLGRSFNTLGAARGARTRILGDQAGDQFSIAAGTMLKKGLASNWMRRVAQEGRRVPQGTEFHIVPRQLADTVSAHYSPRTQGGQGLGVNIPGTHVTDAQGRVVPRRLTTDQFVQQFRNSVLPTSTKWITGNVGEAGLRSAVAGVNPAHAVLARRVLAEMEHGAHHTEADILRAHALGGQYFGLQERLSKQMAAGTTRTPLGKVWHGYNRGVQGVFAADRRMEDQFAMAVLGKYLNRVAKEVGGRDKLAQAMTDPARAAQAGRYVRKVLGQYDAFSPQRAAFTRHLAPFSPWYWNGAKFVYKTMPGEHPAQTAALLDTTAATKQDWEKSHRVNNPDLANPALRYLGQQWGDLMTEPKLSKTQYINLGRYMPYSALSSGPIQSVADALIPQLKSPALALAGKDPFMGDLLAPGAQSKRTPKGHVSHATEHKVAPLSPDALATALSDIIGQEAGPAQALHRVLADQGGTGFSNEKIWDFNPKMKATSYGKQSIPLGLKRVFFPFGPTTINPHKKATSRRSSGASPAGFTTGGRRSKGAAGFTSFHLGDGHRKLAVLRDRVVSRERGLGRGGFMVPGGSRSRRV